MQSAATKPDPVLEQLDRILASPGFARSERLAGFLRFVVQHKLQGKTGELKETVIGTEVFGRAPDYDPRSDPVVRVEAAKLRARLAEYYAGSGVNDSIRIEIPKGAYVPQWQVIGGARRVPRWKWIGLVAAILGITSAVFLWTRPGARPVIAVLPFLNLSSDPDNTYFGDGLADEITGLLSRTEGLEVIARTSAFALKEPHLDARSIGARLNATLLVEGSVQKSSNRLKVIVQLIRAADGKHLWSNTYEREMRDVFATEEEISASIVNALRLKLGGGQRRYTENLEAYQLYLRGRQALARPQADLGLDYFERTVAKDSTYAPAHAGMADALLMMEAAHLLPHNQAFSRAKAAAERALELDPMLSEAHTALGTIGLREYQWREAERSFRRALELNPNSALAHVQLGVHLLVPLGRFDEGIREIRRSLVLDPLSRLTNILLAHALLLAGRYPETVEQARIAVAFDPSRREALDFMARGLSLQGRHAEALAVARGIPRYPDGAGSWVLACVSVRAGLRPEALAILQQNLDAASRLPVPNRRLLMLYGCLGDKERAFEYLEKMYVEREPWLPFYLMYSYPELAWLRSDPRFAAVRQKVGCRFRS